MDEEDFGLPHPILWIKILNSLPGSFGLSMRGCLSYQNSPVDLDAASSAIRFSIASNCEDDLKRVAKDAFLGMNIRREEVLSSVDYRIGRFFAESIARKIIKGFRLERVINRFLS